MALLLRYAQADDSDHRPQPLWHICVCSVLYRGINDTPWSNTPGSLYDEPKDRCCLVHTAGV